jgi:protein-S-isoprenylcysteine O-methyltransferase Ste14
MSNITPYLPIIFAWLIFGLLHSVLASSMLKSKLNLKPINYRRLYNIISILAVMVIFFMGSTISPEYFLPKGQATKSIGLILATFGFLLAKLAFRPISLSQFLGIKKEEESELITTGIYARMRHPLYTALILGLIGFVLFNPTYTHLVHAVCMLVYLGVGIHFEERRLIARFGENYTKYKQQTPMLFPTSFR